MQLNEKEGGLPLNCGGLNEHRRCGSNSFQVKERVSGGKPTHPAMQVSSFISTHPFRVSSFIELLLNTLVSPKTSQSHFKLSTIGHSVTFAA